MGEVCPLFHFLGGVGADSCKDEIWYGLKTAEEDCKQGNEDGLRVHFYPAGSCGGEEDPRSFQRHLQTSLGEENAFCLTASHSLTQISSKSPCNRG